MGPHRLLRRPRAVRHRTQLPGRPGMAAAEHRDPPRPERCDPGGAGGPGPGAARVCPNSNTKSNLPRVMTDTTQLEELVGRAVPARLCHGHRVGDPCRRGLDEDVVRLISRKKGEPDFLLQWRLKALRHWFTLKEPHWAHARYPRDSTISRSRTTRHRKPGPTVRRAWMRSTPSCWRPTPSSACLCTRRARLAGVAVDAVFDSVSVATTFKERLSAAGVIFCSFSEAVRNHPALIEQYLGSVVPVADNFYAALNSAVFSDGSFVYIPKGVRCPDGTVHVFPHQCGQYRPVRAHPDHRGTPIRTSATSRAAPRRCAMRTSCTPQSSNWWHWTMPISSTRPCRTGIPGMSAVSAASTIS